MSPRLNAVDSPWRFGRMSPIVRPFRHFRVDQVLDGELAGRLLDWLEITSRFLARDEDFYRSSAFHVSPQNAPPALEDFFSVHNFQTLRAIMSESFGLTFSERVVLSTNRYEAGEGTLIHTDYQPDHRRDEFSFTHRFLLYLNRGWKPAEGGALGLFDGPEPSDLVTTVRPIHNSGVALEIGQNSYHAVAMVRSGRRYTLNFTFAALEQP